MAKSAVFGNGEISVGLDSFGQVYDFHFPYVGLENHTPGDYLHKIGIWVDDQFSWIDDGSWEINISCTHNDPNHDKIFATNNHLGIALEFEDAVYNEKNIFIRNVLVSNLKEHVRDVRIFFNQQFEIYESERGDTAYYDPENNVIVHYKGRRIFLVNARTEVDLKGFDEYSVGLHKIEGKEGTFKDAEDGKLQKNPIEHGLVDSVIRLKLDIQGNGSVAVDYWITVGKLMDDVYDLNEFVLKRTPEGLVKTSKDYWKAWINKRDIDFKDLNFSVISLYYQSLRICRIHADNTGGIIASSDTDLLKYGRDSYSYVWPRDAALISISMIKAGYPDIAKRFFEFCRRVLTPDGYFMHKYRIDGSIGSSWHPWTQDGKKTLPIQIDETALVVYAVYKYYLETKDIEYIEKIYGELVKKTIGFLIKSIDLETGLIQQSYDLWEENYGISTFTMASVYAALDSAAKLTKIFGKGKRSQEYAMYASKIKETIDTKFYNKDRNAFYKHLKLDAEGNIKSIDVIDSSSLYGVYKFGVLGSEDQKIKDMKTAIHESLECRNDSLKGGFARYEDDYYFRVSEEVTGNPWVITTLWICQLEIEQAKNLDDLKHAKRYIEWTLANAGDGGILPEQINPYTGEQLSAGPLVWSHAELVVTILEYLEKFEALEKKL